MHWVRLQVLEQGWYSTECTVCQMQYHSAALFSIPHYRIKISGINRFATSKSVRLLFSEGHSINGLMFLPVYSCHFLLFHCMQIPRSGSLTWAGRRPRQMSSPCAATWSLMSMSSCLQKVRSCVVMTRCTCHLKPVVEGFFLLVS